MWSLLILLLGIGVCVGAGLLALVPNVERPARFLPVYVLTGALFLGGLAMILWCQPIADYVARR